MQQRVAVAPLMHALDRPLHRDAFMQCEIVAALGGTPAIGTTFELTFVNVAAATHPMVLTAGASGVTLAGVAGMATVAAASSATFLGRVTTASTVTFYRM